MSDETTTELNIPAHRVDLSENPNISELASMLQAASSMQDPADMLGQFGPWVAKRAPREAFISISKRGLENGYYKFTRIMIDNGGQLDPTNPPLNPWSSWDSLETHRGGFVWDLISTPEPKLINNADFSQDPLLSRILGKEANRLRSVAAIPVYEKGDAINWTLSFHTDPEWNDLKNFEMGFLDLNMMGTATRNLVSRRKVEELHAELESQFEQMGQIQRALIPESNPKLDDYELATSYKPCMHAGGDFYNYLQFPDGRLAVMIADVAGHGAAAGTVMAMMGAYLKAFGERQILLRASPDPVEAAKYLNAAMFNSPMPNVFITAFVAILDPSTGTINWTRCGHNPPRIRGVDGSIRKLQDPGTLPLGVVEDLPAESQTSTLDPGETLILYTDGITEASRPADNDAGFEMFGETGLDAAMVQCSGHPGCVIDSINTALFEFVGSDQRNDDQTIVVVRHNHPDDPA